MDSPVATSVPPVAVAAAAVMGPPGRIATRLVQALMDVCVQLDLHSDTYHFHLEVVTTLLVLMGTQVCCVGFLVLRLFRLVREL